MVPARHEGVQALALQSRDVALEASKDALIVRVAHGLQLRLADMGQRFLHFRTAVFFQAVGVLTQAVYNLGDLYTESGQTFEFYKPRSRLYRSQILELKSLKTK